MRVPGVGVVGGVVEFGGRGERIEMGGGCWVLWRGKCCEANTGDGGGLPGFCCVIAIYVA